MSLRTLFRNGASLSSVFSASYALFPSLQGCILLSHRIEEHKMKHQTNHLSSSNASRCRHYTVNGRRCRLPVLDTHSGFCFRHAIPPPAPSHSADLPTQLPPP